MAIYWPSNSSPCRVDILTASLGALENSLVCQGASRGEARAEAPNIYATFLTIKTAYGALTGSQDAIEALQSRAVAEVGAAARASVTQASAALQDAHERASAALIADLNRSKQAELSLIDQATRAVTDAIGSAGDFLGGAIGNVAGGIGGLIGQAQGAVGGLVDTVRGSVGQAVSSASSFVGSLIDQARQSVGDLVSGAGDFLGQVAGQVGESIGGFVQGAGSFLGEVYGRVRGALGAVLDGLGTAVGAIVTGIEGLPALLESVVEQVVDAAGGGLAGVLDAAGTFLTDPVKGIIGSFFHGEEPQVLAMVDSLYDRIAEHPRAPSDLRSAVIQAKTPGHPIPAIVGVLILPIVLGALIGGALGPFGQVLVQEENKLLRPTLLGLSDYVQAQRRGLIDGGTFGDKAARLGYSDGDAAMAVRVLEPQPSPADLIEWYYRKVITEGELRTRLSQLGYSTDDVGRIVAASPVIPSVSDLVRFVVREALPGQSAYGGAAGSSVPGSFVELAAKVGLSPDFARSFWAAHWELPSVGQVFDMYHRGVITEAELDGYLVTADVMPEWRARLKAISFDPLTRVDVRRMYDLGVLDLAGVERAYRDIGYSAENARRLAAFTAALAAEDRKAKPDPEKDLSRSDLVGAYADGILDRATTAGHLRSLGYDATEAEVILDREDIRAERADRKATRDATVEAAVARVIDRNTAGDQLAAAGFTTAEVNATLRDIDRKLAAQTQLPTKADMDRFRKARLVTDDEYREALRTLGYSDRWVELYVKLGVKGTA